LFLLLLLFLFFILQLVCGFHLKASVTVFLLTWFSLYAGWGTYMNIGTVDNYCRWVGEGWVGREETPCTAVIY